MKHSDNLQLSTRYKHSDVTEQIANSRLLDDECAPHLIGSMSCSGLA